MENKKGWGAGNKSDGGEEKEGSEKLMLNFEDRLPFILHTQGH